MITELFRLVKKSGPNIANIDIDKILEQYSNLPKDEYVKKAGIVRNIYESKKYANTCLNESKRSDYQHMY